MPLASNDNDLVTNSPLVSNLDGLDAQPSKYRRIQLELMDITALERDLGLRPLMWEFPVNQSDEIRRAYLKAGPYQPKLSEYPFSGSDNRRHRFQASWFDAHPTWLEYSPKTNSIHCLPRYLFCEKPTRYGSDAFIVKGFENWKKVNDGINCALLRHVGKDPNSLHRINKRLQLKATIDSVRWLAFHGCAFRGHDETVDSQNRGNFIELLKLLATYDAKVAKQMAIILRFVDKEGFIREPFFDVVHVKDTTSLTLKKEICNVLSRYDLHVENIRGQGYDGASNMRGEWNGLQALFLKDCPYAYYVHCMAHRLQLAIVTASREVKQVHQFFTNLSSVINVVVGSSKRNDELQDAQAIAIENMIANNEIETGKRSDTRWGSHLQSICSLLRMFNATCFVINTISNEGANYSIRGDAEATYLPLTSFEFVFIMHLTNEIMGITDILCRALQQNSQDIVNAIQLVSTTKALIQDLRDDGWQPLLENVKAFWSKNEIDIPNLEGVYTRSRSKSRHQGNSTITIEHHFRVDIFCATIDCQLQELNSRFYSTEQEKVHLRFQLRHYELDISKDLDFQNLATLSKLLRLVLILPVSTATTERAFAVMKLIKIRLCSRMEDEYLADNLVVYIEKKIAKNFTVEMTMDEFYSMKYL
ncbi:hypothetical protein P3X46_017087 [Hevea brasiliensis]|uniref:TTF-type domain-containing protein n=1 Tax=Hevea brasiliensis TaxID=3981 RepID=A0ABQ9M3E7_HEVBR|nr:hypothetical protein P3X46_017087 [Hevea brasiliensis]